MKIRKKPIIVDAWRIDTLEIQYQGNVPDWVWKAAKEDKVIAVASDGHDMVLRIKTREGIMQAKDGDVLVKGVRKELYPIEAGIFAETYDIVEEDELFDDLVGEKVIKVESITDNPDGSADIVVNMDYESMVNFARIGLLKTIRDAADTAEKELNVQTAY